MSLAEFITANWNDAEAEDDIEELERLAADPTQIETRERAAEVIAALDHKIAAIQMQLDVAGIEAGVRPLTPDREDWVRRAAYAKAMTVNQRDRVYRRDQELRGIKRAAHTEAAAALKAAKVERHKQLAEEAEKRREEKRIKHEATVAAAAEAKARHLATVEQQRAEQMRLAQAKRELEASRHRERERFFVEIAKTRMAAEEFRAIWQEVDAALQAITQ